MRPAIFNYLSNDATLMALLPGGLYDGALVDFISRQNTPAAFDGNQEILPCVLLRLRGPTPLLPYAGGRGCQSN